MKTCSVVLQDTSEIKGQCYSFFPFTGIKNACNSKTHLPLEYQVVARYKKHKPETERNKREIKMESAVVDVVRFKSAGRETKNEEWMQAI